MSSCFQHGSSEDERGEERTNRTKHLRGGGEVDVRSLAALPVNTMKDLRGKLEYDKEDTEWA